MDLRSQVGLPHAKSFRNSRDGHPDVNAKARNVSIPDVLFQVTGCEPTGYTEFAADGLPHGFPIERPRHRINDAVRDGSVVLMSMVVGSDVVVFVFEHGLPEQFDPAGSNTPQVGIHYHTCFGLQALCHSKDCAEGASLAGKTVIRSADAIAHLNGMRNQE